MSRAKTIAFDATKLREMFRRRGLTLSEVSTEMGHCKDFLCNCAKHGVMTAATARQLETMYNIHVEPVTPVKEARRDTPAKALIQQTEMDIEKMAHRPAEDDAMQRIAVALEEIARLLNPGYYALRDATREDSLSATATQMMRDRDQIA